MEWSENQLAILNGTGNMLVSASAGSGKTTVMIEKIRRLLTAGASLKHMVICTYTVAAAADIKYKLAAALAGAGLKNELEYLPQADISTLHGICSRLVRSYFYRTDADPAFELMSEGEAAAVQAECMSTVLARAAGERFSLLYDAMLVNRTDKAIRKTVTAIYSFARTQPTDGWLNDCLSLYDKPEAVLDALKALLNAERQGLLGQADALCRETAAAGFTRNLDACAALGDWLNRLAPPPRTPGTRIPAGMEPLNERFKALKERIRKFLEREDEILAAPDAGEARPEAEVLVSLARDFAAEYAAAKRRKGKLDFADLEHYALEILGSPSADEITGRIQYVFVDEYQDVNPLQEEILNRLSARAQLFEVGDLKQSIYAFRLCDPRIFADKYRLYRQGAGGRAIDLNVNYRSAQGVIDGVNEVFDRAMTEEFGGVDYTRARLVCGLNKPGERVRLKLVTDDTAPSYPAVYSVREDGGGRSGRSLAEAVARDVVDLLAGTTEDNGRTRPVRPSDIAVIARSRSETLSELYAVLKGLKIPVAYAMKTRAADSEAVRPLINMLRLIDNRTDDVMLAACLKSKFGGFTDDELAEIRRAGERAAGRDCTFCEAAAAYRGSLRARLDAFGEKLDRYEAFSQYNPADETAGLIVSEAEYFEYLYSQEGGETLAGVLSGFLRLAGEVAVTVPELLDYVDSEPEQADGESAGDCVRLMTVHASKGLEFKYVLLVGVEQRFRLDDAAGTVLLDREYGLSVKQFDYEARTARKTKLYYLAAAAVRKRMGEEELRILYVAMTRAKDKLYAYGAARKERDGGAVCFLDWLLPALAPEYVPASAELPSVPPRRTVAARPDETLLKAVRAKLDFRYEHLHVPQKTAVTALAEQADEEGGHAYVSAGTDTERAAEVGTAYHLVMEHIDFAADFGAEWTRLCGLFPAETALCDAERIRLAADCMASLTAGKRTYREQPFILDVDGTLVQGVIDLLIVDGDRAAVVDYKTTRSRDLATPAYLFQTGMYARAVRRLLGLNVSEVYLYSFYMDRLVPMPRGEKN